MSADVVSESLGAENGNCPSGELLAEVYSRPVVDLPTLLGMIPNEWVCVEFMPEDASGGYPVYRVLRNPDRAGLPIQYTFMRRFHYEKSFRACGVFDVVKLCYMLTVANCTIYARDMRSRDGRPRPSGIQSAEGFLRNVADWVGGLANFAGSVAGSSGGVPYTVPAVAFVPHQRFSLYDMVILATNYDSGRPGSNNMIAAPLFREGLWLYQWYVSTFTGGNIPAPCMTCGMMECVASGVMSTCSLCGAGCCINCSICCENCGYALCMTCLHNQQASSYVARVPMGIHVDWDLVKDGSLSGNDSITVKNRLVSNDRILRGDEMHWRDGSALVCLRCSALISSGPEDPMNRDVVPDPQGIGGRMGVHRYIHDVVFGGDDALLPDSWFDTSMYTI